MRFYHVMVVASVMTFFFSSCKSNDHKSNTELSAVIEAEQDLFICRGNLTADHDAVFEQIYNPTDSAKSKIVAGVNKILLVKEALAAVPAGVLAHYFSFSDAKVTLIREFPAYHEKYKDFLNKNAIVLYNKQNQPAAYLKGTHSNLGFSAIPEIFVNITPEAQAAVDANAQDTTLMRRDISMVVAAFSVYWAFSASTTTPVLKANESTLDWVVSAELAKAKRALAYIALQELRHKSASVPELMDDSMKAAIEDESLATPITTDWAAVAASPDWASDFKKFVDNYNSGKGRVFSNWVSANLLEAHLCNTAATIAFAQEPDRSDANYGAQYPLTAQFFNEQLKVELLAGLEQSVAFFLKTNAGDNVQGLSLAESEEEIVLERMEDKASDEVIDATYAKLSKEGMALTTVGLFPRLRTSVGWAFQTVGQFSLELGSRGIAFGGRVVSGALSAPKYAGNMIRMGVISVSNFVRHQAYRVWNAPVPRMVRYRAASFFGGGARRR